jgi:hypothetical protein
MANAASLTGLTWQPTLHLPAQKRPVCPTACSSSMPAFRRARTSQTTASALVARLWPLLRASFELPIIAMRAIVLASLSGARSLCTARAPPPVFRCRAAPVPWRHAGPQCGARRLFSTSDVAAEGAGAKAGNDTSRIVGGAFFSLLVRAKDAPPASGVCAGGEVGLTSPYSADVLSYILNTQAICAYALARTDRHHYWSGDVAGLAVQLETGGVGDTASAAGPATDRHYCRGHINRRGHASDGNFGVRCVVLEP